MKLKVKDLDISTGRSLVAILNEADAGKLDLHALDRIKILYGKKIETVMVNIAESDKSVKAGEIGLVEEVIRSLGVRNNAQVGIMLARKPLSLEHIKKKLDGKILSKDEIEQIVWDIVHNKLSDIELTYFVAACYSHSMSMKETIALTKAIAYQGDVFRVKRYPIVDKHCIGGIPGNRTSMILVPMIAAAGFTIPKTSSRSITSPAGTADTMEVLCNVCFDINRMKRIVSKINGCLVWGGALNLAPADDKIIHVEKPLGIDAESQLLASILAKKLSVSSTHVIIDIPVGRNTKIENKKDALELKNKFETVGKILGMHIEVVITYGDEPIGFGIGPALEARDVLYVLRRDEKRPIDLEEKCIMMAGRVFEMLGKRNGRKIARDILESGKAYEKMKDIIRMQGGNPNITPEKIKLGKCVYSFKAKKSGKISMLNNYAFSKIARIAGAPVDKSAGIYLMKHVRDSVKKGETVFEIYADSDEKLRYAVDIANEMYPLRIG